MKKFILLFAIIAMFVSVNYSQDKIDVVTLNNGDIRKGTIIENVPNNYIKIETSDGSVFTIKYSEIAKMTKENKTANYSNRQDAPQGLMARTGDFGVTASLWLGGTIYCKGDRDTDPAFLARIFYDYYVVDKFSVGIYSNVSPFSVIYGYSLSSTALEIGGAFKARFPLAADGSSAIKIGLNVGYRTIMSDVVYIDGTNALGINASVELQFNANSFVVPFAEIGFLSQPVGGTKYADITFAPIIYIGGGVAF